MDWIKCLKEYRRVFRAHAISRIFERNIGYGELVEAFEKAEVIEEYPNDHPYPSCLILGFTRLKKPIHTVFSINHNEEVVVIVTVYIPEKGKWTDDYRRRNK
jgi:hypothetical protein